LAKDDGGVVAVVVVVVERYPGDGGLGL